VATLVSIYLCPSMKTTHPSLLLTNKWKLVHPRPPCPQIAIGTFKMEYGTILPIKDDLTKIIKDQFAQILMHEVQLHSAQILSHMIRTHNLMYATHKIQMHSAKNLLGKYDKPNRCKFTSKIPTHMVIVHKIPSYKLQNPTTQCTKSKS
jgi:hypothetical protein